MGTTYFKYGQPSDKSNAHATISSKDLARFDASLLDIGDIAATGHYKDALAAIFDLEGFTAFCNQIDPYLVIPDFLQAFLSWLFTEIKREAIQDTREDPIHLWCQLPFFSKFLGDGVLFLWDTSNMDQMQIANMVVSLRIVCDRYGSGFWPKAGQQFARAPKRLRCGIARGQVTSIGEGKDFVGPCINVAARLQKLGDLSFAFSRRGFNLAKDFNEESAKRFALVRVPLRGLGDDELVHVDRQELKGLSDEQKKTWIVLDQAEGIKS